MIVLLPHKHMASLLKVPPTHTTISISHSPSSHTHLPAEIRLNANTLPTINGHELALEWFMGCYWLFINSWLMAVNTWKYLNENGKILRCWIFAWNISINAKENCCHQSKTLICYNNTSSVLILQFASLTCTLPLMLFQCLAVVSVLCCQTFYIVSTLKNRKCSK